MKNKLYYRGWGTWIGKLKNGDFVLCQINHYKIRILNHIPITSKDISITKISDL